MDAQRQWHRLFGMSWTDFFTGTSVVVEMEKDLSIKQQLLDVVLLRKDDAPLPYRPPDGFEDLANHNLVSFKSYQETLDGWTLLELLGHYVNYRKQVSPSVDDVLPEDGFRLFAVSVRFPQALSQRVHLEPVQDGVYDLPHYTGAIRVVVIHQLPQVEQNAMLHLFSARQEQVRYGAGHYRPRSEQTSTFLYQLYDRYREEGMPVPFTREEFFREAIANMLRDPEVVERAAKEPAIIDRVAQSPEVIDRVLDAAPVEKRLEGLSVEELLAGLSAEVREALEARLRKGDDTRSAT